jgi:hypothetical protein
MGAAQVENVQDVYISRGLTTSPTKQPTRKARNITLGGITFMPTVDFLRMPSTAEILSAVGEEDPGRYQTTTERTFGLIRFSFCQIEQCAANQLQVHRSHPPGKA